VADRTSAGIFGDIFVYLAGRQDTETGEISEEDLAHARYFWGLSRGYDFDPRQMGVEPKDLERLGLARQRPTGPDEEEGPWWFYGPPDAEVK